MIIPCTCMVDFKTNCPQHGINTHDRERRAAWKARNVELFKNVVDKKALTPKVVAMIARLESFQ